MPQIGIKVDLTTKMEKSIANKRKMEIKEKTQKIDNCNIRSLNEREIELIEKLEKIDINRLGIRKKGKEKLMLTGCNALIYSGVKEG